MVIFVLCSSLVLANLDWSTYGNDLPNFISGNKTLLYSSGMVSNHNTSNQFHCSIYENPLYESLIYDINSDGVNEIVFVNDANRLQIYDMDCNILETVLIEDSVRSMPVHVRMIGNSGSEDYLFVQGDSWIHLFVNNGTNTFYIHRISTLHSKEDGFNCFEYSGDAICSTIGFTDVTNKNMTAYRIEQNGNLGFPSYSYQNKTHTLLYSGEGLGIVNDFKSIPVGVYNPSLNNYLTGYVSTGSSGSTQYIKTASAIGLLSSGTYPVFQPLNCTLNRASTITNSHYNLGMATIGTSKTVNAYMLSSDILVSGIHSATYLLCDGTGNVRAYIGNASTINTANWDISSWACGDINKDGSNECCVMYNNVTTSNSGSRLLCYNGAYQVMYNQTFDTYTSSSIGLADFDSSNSMLELVTMDGIFSMENQSIINDISLYTYDQSGSLSIAVKDSNVNNFAVYTQATSLEVFGFGNLATFSCGDGTCSQYENAFVCPEDCNINATEESNIKLGSGETCINDTECITGHCLYNFCTPKDAGIECSSDVECLSASCVKGKCLKASLWQMIDQAKNDNVGDDEATNNLVSIVTLIFVGGGLISSGTIVGVGIGVGFVFLAGGFLAYVGWLSFWIFGLLVVGALIGATIILAVGMGKNQ